MNSFNLEIITPHKVALQEKEVERIIVRTTEGDMGILAKHAPLVAELTYGEMKIKKSDKESSYYVSGGFLEISKERVLVLADQIIKSDEIDVESAKRDKEIHEAKLKKLTEDREIASTQRALQESLTKINIGNRR